MGATGGILALACVLPDICVQLFTLAHAQRHAEARALQQRILPMAKLIGTVYGVPGLKAAARLAGFDAGLPRLPLAPVDDAALDELKTALAACTPDPAEQEASSRTML
jgi:dihydrodipicolinate synthase/N-acetylneuraminate lyase